jgi:hypothetical protein
MTACAAIGLSLDIARRPGENNGSKALDGDYVHPLFQVDFCAIQGSKPSNYLAEYAI